MLSTNYLKHVKFYTDRKREPTVCLILRFMIAISVICLCSFSFFLFKFNKCVIIVKAIYYILSLSLLLSRNSHKQQKLKFVIMFDFLTSVCCILKRSLEKLLKCEFIGKWMLRFEARKVIINLHLLSHFTFELAK